MTQQNGQENDFSAKELRDRAKQYLNHDPQSDAHRRFVPSAARIEGQVIEDETDSCPAAVLVPIILRESSAQVLLTRRADDHPHHAGQISFPGGKITPQDGGIAAAALRETREETGIDQRHIDLVGSLEQHRTGTGFTIYPVVGLLDSSFDLQPCSKEVAEIFEVPFSFVMNGDNYRLEEIIWRGRLRKFYVIDYGPYRIWGATAAILKMLQERLYG